MIDPKLLRNSAEDVKANLARRGFDFDADTYLALEEKRKALQVDTEDLQSERNTRSKAIGQAKAKGEDIAPLLEAVADLGDRLEVGQSDLHAVQTELRDIELGLHEHAVTGESLVRTQRGVDDAVDVILAHASGIESILGCAGAKIAGAHGLLVEVDKAALLNAGPLLDPLVGGIHELCELVVGDHTVRQEVASSKKYCVRHCRKYRPSKRPFHLCLAN